MGFQCAPQVMGLVRGEPRSGQKHRANGGKIAREAGSERHSKTNTLDRTLSHLNEYTGFESGDECWDYMEERAASYKQKVTGKDRKGNSVTRERGLRKDAVIGWAVIIHPADEVTADWAWEDFDRFDRDAMSVLAEIKPELFRASNEQMSATHKDEAGKHRHHIGDCIAEDGSYCGALIDAKLLTEINEAFPKLMRERGWEVDDMDVTDWEHVKTDEVYRNERNEKRKSQRKATNDYATEDNERLAKESLAQAEALLVEAKEIEADANRAAARIKADAQAEANKIKSDADSAAQATLKDATERANSIQAEAELAAKHRLGEITKRESSVAVTEAKQSKRQKEFQAWEDKLSAQQDAIEVDKESLAAELEEAQEVKHQFAEATRRVKAADPTIDDVPLREAVPVIVKGIGVFLIDVSTKVEAVDRDRGLQLKQLGETLLNYFEKRNLSGKPLMDVLIEKLEGSRQRKGFVFDDLPRVKEHSIDMDYGDS